MKKIKITISITNLEDYSWKYYNISNIKEYDEAINNYFKYNGDSDFEVQLIDTNVIWLTDNNLLLALDFYSNNKDNYTLDEIATILHFFDEDEAIDILKNRIACFIDGSSKENAYREYCEELGIYDIDHIYYELFDWELITRNFECSGGKIYEYQIGKFIIA